MFYLWPWLIFPVQVYTVYINKLQSSIFSVKEMLLLQTEVLRLKKQARVQLFLVWVKKVKKKLEYVYR